MRVSTFLDVQNIYYSFKNHYNGKADFEKLLAAAANGRQMVRNIAYVVTDPANDFQGNFIYFLNQLGIETKTKDLIRRQDSSVKGNFDIEMVLDIVEIAPRTDVICVISNDGDFSPLGEYLRNHGVRFEVLGIKELCAQNLKEAAHEFISIDSSFVLESEG